MEDWQIQHINKNINRLVKATTWNTDLATELKSSGILSDFEIKALDGLPNLHERSTHLYELLSTREGAFDILIKLLTNCRQSGAVKILNSHTYRQLGSISFDKCSVLGEGNFAVVYQGTFDGRDVAVKVLNKDRVKDEIVQKELDVLRKLDNHANIVRYYFYETHENCIYIALELCRTNLDTLLELKEDIVDCTSFLKQCVSGLAYLHKHNIIHRDLKPANILITHQNQVKLSDFGLCKITNDGRKSVNATTMAGTLDWVAPELQRLHWQPKTRGQKITIKINVFADIFSLGCIFYYVLTNGSHPFGDPWDRANHIIHNKPQIQDTSVETNWLDLVKRMISKDDHTRPSAEDILNADVFQHNSKSISTCTEVSTQTISPPPEDSIRLPRPDPKLTSPVPGTSIYRRQIVTVEQEYSPYFLPPHGSENKNSRSSNIHTEHCSQDETGGQIPSNHEEVGQTTENSQHEFVGYELANKYELPKKKKFSCTQTSHPEESKKPCLDIAISSSTIPAPCNDSESCDQKIDHDGCLLDAIKNNCEMSVIIRLIEDGANFNMRTSIGKTLAHLAVEKGRLDIIGYLKQRGVSLNETDSNGNTLLHLAHTNFDMIKSLVDLGVNMQAVNNKLNSVVHEAASSMAADEFYNFVTYVQKHVDCLLQQKNDKERIPIHERMYSDKAINIETFNLLGGTSGFKTDAEDVDGNTMLLSLVRGKQNLIHIDLLIREGSDVNKINKNGENALHLAVVNTNKRLVKDLVSKGVNLNQKDNLGRTPLTLAETMLNSYNRTGPKKTIENIMTILKSKIENNTSVVK